jgi:hypothetical protein
VPATRSASGGRNDLAGSRAQKLMAAPGSGRSRLRPARAPAQGAGSAATRAHSSNERWTQSSIARPWK